MSGGNFDSALPTSLQSHIPTHFLQGQYSRRVLDLRSQYLDSGKWGCPVSRKWPRTDSSLRILQMSEAVSITISTWIQLFHTFVWASRIQFHSCFLWFRAAQVAWHEARVAPPPWGVPVRLLRKSHRGRLRILWTYLRVCCVVGRLWERIAWRVAPSWK